MDLLTAVEHWAKETPDRPVHECSGRSISYGELLRYAQAVASQIDQRGLPPGAPIVVRAHKEPEALIGFIGAGLAGHPYVPVDSGLPESRVAMILESAGAHLAIDPETIARMAEMGGSVLRRDRLGDEIQYIMFTSGSTGRPKGVPISRGNLAEFSRWLLAEQRFVASEERILDQAVYSFDLSVMSIYPAIVTGGTLIGVTGDALADLGQLFRTLARSDITTWVSTPSFVQLCLQEPRFSGTMLPNVRRFLFCGEALPAATVRSLHERFPGRIVWNTYGPTEATVAVTSVAIEEPLLERHETLPIGRVRASNSVRIVSEDLQLATPGDRGEILITGPQVSPGYLAAPDSDRAFCTWEDARAYRTGDIGHEESGLLFFDGRKDDQIKLHGYRIELGDVESNLAALAGVQAAAVVVIARSGVPDSLAGFVVLDPSHGRPGEDAGRALKTALAARIPSYMVPRRIRILPRLPMTSNGKVDRRALVDLHR